jgi:undecaprenyl diphosphate synthase
MTNFTKEELQRIDKAKIPTHIAIIPDGNRRWAEGFSFPTLKGHIAGADAAVEIVRAAKELGVKVLTLYAFSTENWKRPKDEVDHLMLTIEKYLTKHLDKLVDQNIRLRSIGRLDELPQNIKSIVDKATAKTAHCRGFDLVLAINYGGRDELVRAMHKLLQTNPQNITENLISQYLDTKELPDPDLIIRTSGEKRISNFLLWQSSYSELYIDQTAWPAFTPKHLLAAIMDYQTRKRRIGGDTA